MRTNRNNIISSRWLLIAVFWTAVMSGCISPPAALQTPLPSQTPTPLAATHTPTPTIVWFPPTETPTPFPTPTTVPPTPEMRPGIGQRILEDNFDDGSLWQLSSLPEGSALLGLNEITIAISKKRVYVSSLRTAPPLANFYAEISVNPSFCRGLDEYGLLFRAASVQDFYRFGISCDGQVRLDRIFRGGASSPQPWLMSGAVPIGSPSYSRLGVWAVGSEMRFFFNEEFLFAVQDGTIPAGVIGVFARSTSDEPLTVNFSELSIWEVTSSP